jgi:predicted RNA binding protein YcfA (HicA-like mRNA interferase family)
MGSKLKILSSDDVLKILAIFGFVMYSQKGSHIKLRRYTVDAVETLIIPNHNPIAKGTLQKIFKQASLYVSSDDLHKHFYTK